MNRIAPLLSNCLALFAIYYFLMPAPAYGYFDLGTGTYMIQMLLGFGAAVWLSMRTSWIRFGRASGKTKAGAASATADSAVETPAPETAPNTSNTPDTDDKA